MNRGNDSDDDDSSDESNDGEMETRNGFDQISNFDEENAIRKKRRKQIELLKREDDEYEGEWGYALMKALRGKSVGRRLRRKLFKFGVFQVFCGFPLLILAIQEGYYWFHYYCC